MTALDLIKGSLRLIGALATGETPTANEAADALAALNDLVDAWATERLTVYTESRAVYSFPAGKSPLLIGPANADFTAPRPVDIVRAGLVNVTANAAFPPESPLEILTAGEWAAVGVKNLTSTLPTKLYYDRAFPAGNIYLWPIPVQANALALYTPQAVSTFPALTTAIALPPGYNRALRYNLACELAPEWGRPLDAATVQIALDAKQNLKLANLQLDGLRCDPGLRGHSARFNYLTGAFRP